MYIDTKYFHEEYIKILTSYNSRNIIMSMQLESSNTYRNNKHMQSNDEF